MTRNFLLSVMLFASLWATACDVCGIYLGVLPNDRRTSVGLFWRNRLMRGTTMLPNTSPMLLAKHGDHATDGVPSAEVPMTELVNVLELRGDLRLSERFFVLASLPLTNTYRGINGYRMVDAYGLGDPFVLFRYQLVNTKCKTAEVRTVHRLMVGAGPKFPLGRNNLTSQGELVSPDMQLGTGSWDALVSVEYAVRRGRTGGGLSMLGRYNTANDRGYQLGHGLSITGEAFHRFGTDTLSIAPVVGAYMELMDHDVVNGEAQTGTAGSALFAQAGMRLWWQRFAFSAFYQPALLNNEGIDITPTRHRIVVGITYNLNNN
ncbi:MAG: hypothetical protein KA230_10620 [Flavobacteriales bacterium]|nr:hypothetical protein [Flavobacteriales bacterium]